ncbi:MAG TPA: helix-turn-helix domain-containing protein [Burkholderiales bacterium]|nr:helix-turn-helix domain-containing protein [Burkholderiales bacterium]
MSSVTRTLAVALCSLGSLERLAGYLGVSEAQLAAWLTGECTPPTTISVRALDAVAFIPRNKAR